MHVPQSKIIFIAFFNNFLIFNMDLPASKNPRSSINNKQIISHTYFSISKNISLIYIRKKMGDIGNLCDILVFTSHLGLMNLSIISCTHLLVRRDYIYPIISWLILKSAIFWANLALKTWSNVSLTSINRIPAICQLF